MTGLGFAVNAFDQAAMTVRDRPVSSEVFAVPPPGPQERAMAILDNQNTHPCRWTKV